MFLLTIKQQWTTVEWRPKPGTQAPEAYKQCKTHKTKLRVLHVDRAIADSSMYETTTRQHPTYYYHNNGTEDLVRDHDIRTITLLNPPTWLSGAGRRPSRGFVPSRPPAIHAPAFQSPHWVRHSLPRSSPTLIGLCSLTRSRKYRDGRWPKEEKIVRHVYQACGRFEEHAIIDKA